MTSLTVVQRPSPNKSTRSGTVRIIVLHISAGATTNENLAPFLQDPSSQVSYHVSVDDDPPNTVFKYVDEAPFQSWSCASFNGVSVNGCICAPGEAVNWSRQQWLDREGNALASLAQWVALMADRFNIPLTALSASQAQGSGRGVCQHRDLGAAGGGHSDCGENFPMTELLNMARGDQPAPQPPPATRHGEEYEPMQLEYGPDGKCSIGVPKDVTHFRVNCSQGGTLNVQWPGKQISTVTVDLSGYKRIDVALPNAPTVDAAQTGQVILFRPGAETSPVTDPGPVSFCWIAK